VVRDTNAGVDRLVTARYVIAADGAHSVVRDRLGIEMEGPDDLEDYERVEFLASLDEVVGDRRYALYVITDPGVGGVVAPRGPGDRWGLSRERRGNGHPLATLDEPALIALVRAAAGVDDLPASIERTSNFTFATQIAERYRHHCCFLVGDAAHRMTPRGGTGMNTAIQDAFDLGWKLGWVLRGWSDLGLLDTYEDERRPVGLHNVGRTGEPGGARRETHEALPWDLNGRVDHHWVDDGDERRSTLDMIGDGITVFLGPDATPPEPESSPPAGRPPLQFHVLDADTIQAYGLPPTGVLVVRPDGRELTRASSLHDVDLPNRRSP